MILNSKYDIALGYLNVGNPDNIRQAFHEIAWVESKGIVDRKQNDDPDAYAKGLGLGKYQYEPESAKTALTRYKNWHEKNQPPNLDDMYAEAVRRLDTEDYDFSTLSEDHQDVYNLINYQQHPKTKMKDLSSGAISPKSFWAQYHATIGKFSEEDRFKQWENQIKGLPELIPSVSKDVSFEFDSFLNPSRNVFRIDKLAEDPYQVNVDTKNATLGAAGILKTPYGTASIDNKGEINARTSPNSRYSLGYNSKTGLDLKARYGDWETLINETGVEAGVDINDKTRFSAKKDFGGDFKAMFSFNTNFQEGGEVQDDVGIPPMPKDPTQDVTIGTSPDAFVKPGQLDLIPNIPSVNTVDTTQGFYAYNPAPGESIEDFTARTASQFEYEPRETTQTGSWGPPEGYVSPRGLPTTGGSGTPLDYTDMSGLTGTVTIPSDYPTTDTALLDTLGTVSDISAAGDIFGDADYSGEGIGGSQYSTIDFLGGQVTLDDVQISSTFAGQTTYGVSPDFTTRVDAWLAETNGLRAANGLAPFTTDIAANYIRTMDYIDTIGTMNTTDAINSMAKININGVNYGNYITDTPDVITADGVNTTMIKNHINESIGVLTTDDVQLGFDPHSPTFGDDRNWFQQMGDKHLFNVGDTDYSVEVKDLYDEFATAMLVGLGTGDWGKAGIAATGQFIKSDVVEAYAKKAQAAVGGQAGIDLANKWRAFGGAATSAATVLAMGGSAEDAAFAAAQEAITVFGAEKVGEMFGVTSAIGISGGETAAQRAVGGAAIAGLVAFLRTGKLETAAQSAATSYAFSVNPVLGIAALALGFLFGQKEPSYRSGYASIDLDNFELNKYSQGDFDSSKADPQNVEFSATLMEPMIPYIKELEASTGFDFKGDIQIHYAGNKPGAGVYYTIGNRDQEGLSAREMFLNRIDYYDGKDQSTQDGGKVYRRYFAPTEEGLNLMYESLFADLEYIAENKITDLTHYTGIIKSQEEIQQELKNSGFDINTFTANIRQGGKISLDKGGNVQYNKGNYGLVNKKDKAPPSARADDVPMTLKEGDFVLSQPAVALYGKDTIDRMLSRAATDAGKNLKSGGKVPVNVHNGEYIIPKNLTEYIGPNVLETMNNRGLMSVGERPNT